MKITLPKKSRGQKILEALGVGGLVAGGILGVIALLALLFFVGTLFTAFFVALAWNWLGLHELFDAPSLTFWQVFAVAVVINIIRSIFSVSVNKDA
jgi:hypothetical protein